MQQYLSSTSGVTEAEDVQLRAVDSKQFAVQRGFVATVEPEGIVEVISNADGEVFTIVPQKLGEYLITFDDGVHRTRLAGEVIEESVARVMISTRGPILQSSASPQDAGSPGPAIAPNADGGTYADGVRGDRPVRTRPV
jgi:hypothetical protein